MSTLTIYHNPHCSKSREALSLLLEYKQQVEVIEYLKNPLDENQLLQLLEMLGPASANLVRTTESDFKENPFDVNSKQEIAQQLALRPRLMQRPVIVINEHAFIPRPIELIYSKLGLKQPG